MGLFDGNKKTCDLCGEKMGLLGDGENPTVGFYDLAALSELMNEFFGESLNQAA